MRRLAALVLALAALSTPAHAEPAAVQPGGSNFTWYRLNGCDREPYSTISSFHTAAAPIRQALADLYGAGQRRLRIGIFHSREAGATGTTMNSSGGNLSARNRQNLTDFLAAVKAAGFAEIEVAFHPMGRNDPHDAEGYDPGRYEENRDVIVNLRPLIAAAGIPYRIDLLNEGLPMTSEPVLAEYSRRLWSDYTAAFGKADTVGFSMTVWIANRVEMMDHVYAGNVPDVFDVHLYGDDRGNGDEYQQFVAAHDKMAERGLQQGWIIGETHFNDPTAAGNIRRAMADTGRTVFYLTQWPRTRPPERCPDVDVAPPTDFTAYQAQGF